MVEMATPKPTEATPEPREATPPPPPPTEAGTRHAEVVVDIADVVESEGDDERSEGPEEGELPSEPFKDPEAQAKELRRQTRASFRAPKPYWVSETSEMSSVCTTVETMSVDVASEEPVERVKVNYYTVLMVGFLLLNLLALALLLLLGKSEGTLEHSATLATANLLVLTAFRNEHFLRGLFWVARRHRVELLHRLTHNYGGVHASAGMCCTAWVWISVGFGVGMGEMRTAIVVLRCLIGSMLLVVGGVGVKRLRHRFHNAFEILHRYTSWVLLGLLLADIILQLPEAWSTPVPYLWLATLLLILSSWGMVRKERCRVMMLSKNSTGAVVVDLPGVKFGGSGMAIKLSRDGVEWHSFAVCPSFYDPYGGSMCLVAAAGDWTKQLIKEAQEGTAPDYIYVRSMFPGFMNSTNVYKKIVCVGTGAGIAPILATIQTTESQADVKLVWVTNKVHSDVERFILEQKIDYHIFDTKVRRPEVQDIMEQVPEGTEAVFVVSNPKFTREMKVYCNDRNIVCYGANWDS